MINDFKDLVVWQKSMTLAEETYKIVALLPKEETYALSAQMRRAAVSVPSNIAEGYDRNSDKELRSFLHIARGSCAELETQIILCVKLAYLNKEQAKPLYMRLTEVRKLINAFIRKLKE